MGELVALSILTIGLGAALALLLVVARRGHGRYLNGGTR